MRFLCVVWIVIWVALSPSPFFINQMGNLWAFPEDATPSFETSAESNPPNGHRYFVLYAQPLSPRPQRLGCAGILTKFSLALIATMSLGTSVPVWYNAVFNSPSAPIPEDPATFGPSATSMVLNVESRVFYYYLDDRGVLWKNDHLNGKNFSTAPLKVATNVQALFQLPDVLSYLHENGELMVITPTGTQMKFFGDATSEKGAPLRFKQVLAHENSLIGLSTDNVLYKILVEGDTLKLAKRQMDQPITHLQYEEEERLGTGTVWVHLKNDSKLPIDTLILRFEFIPFELLLDRLFNEDADEEDEMPPPARAVPLLENEHRA